MNQPDAQGTPYSAPRPHSEQPSIAGARGRLLSALGITGAAGPKSSNWQALRHSKFRWYFTGSVTSNFGTWLQNTAQVVLASSSRTGYWRLAWSPAPSSPARCCWVRGRPC